MTKERRLGRGLEALLGRLDNVRSEGEAGFQRDDHESQSTTSSAEAGMHWIPIYDIDRNPFQPRTTFDDGELQALSESLSAHGMLQPMLVRRAGDRYQLISGERRWRAATVAGWEKVPAQVWEADDRQMAELALVENVQRKDLNPLEKAASFQRYLQQYGCTQEELANRVNLDRSTIANLVRLLELPTAVQDALRSGTITQGHARALLPLGDEREQVQLCAQIQAEGLSVRATESLVQATIHQADGEPQLSVVSSGETSRTAARSEQLSSLEHEFRRFLGTKVDIRQASKGRGRIVIHFTSAEEFERLRAYLNQPGQPASRVG